MEKLRFSTKFPDQEIRWNDGILRSAIIWRLSSGKIIILRVIDKLTYCNLKIVFMSPVRIKSFFAFKDQLPVKSFFNYKDKYLRSYFQDLFASVSVVLSMDLSKMDKIRVSKPSTQTLTDFMPIYSFLTPWKHQKTTGFLMLSGGYEKKILTWNRLIQILDIDPKEAAVGWVEEVIVRRVPEKNVALKVDSLAVAFKIFFRR